MDNKEYSNCVDTGCYPDEMLVPIDSAFEDLRGKIQNILLSPIESVAIITSKAGTVRSNHWHKYNWHYLYVISGSMKYLEKELDNSNLKEVIIKAGEMVFTAPNKAHRTEFLEDTVLLSLGKSPKDHDSHEEDLVRIEW